MNDFQFDTIEQALGDLRAGKVILVTDDPDRENEGDLICAAQFATTENVNFMASVGKGLICMPMSAGAVPPPALPPDGHRQHRQPRDGIHRVGGSCGHDNGHPRRRARPDGAQSGGPTSSPSDFRRPGHMFPLMAKPLGVLERNGHTEATVDLCRLARP